MLYQRCVTEEAVRRQEAVEQCLLDKMSAGPYRQISVSDICQAVGISRTAFYRYYKDKDACLCALLDRKLLESATTTMQGPSVPHEKQIVDMLQFWKNEKQLLDALDANGLISMLVERTVHYLEQEAPEIQAMLATDRVDCDRDVLIFTLSGLVSLITSWHHSGFSQSSEEMSQKVMRLLSQPLFHLR